MSKHGLRSAFSILTGKGDPLQQQPGAKPAATSAAASEDDKPTAFRSKFEERLHALRLAPDRAAVLQSVFQVKRNGRKKLTPDQHTKALACTCVAAFFDKWERDSTAPGFIDPGVQSTFFNTRTHYLFDLLLRTSDDEFRAYMAGSYCPLEQVDGPELRRVRALIAWAIAPQDFGVAREMFKSGAHELVKDDKGDF